MATYLIDCGPGGEILELGRRVVSYLGPEAALGRSSDLTYGGVDSRPTGADVFIGLQATSATGTETWVHPRSGDRSRALAETIQAEMVPYGARGVTRTGDLSALAPERHASGAAACVVEIDDRTRRDAGGAAADGMAQAIARAARSARQVGGTNRVAYGHAGNRVANGGPYGGYAGACAYNAYPAYSGYGRFASALDESADPLAARFQQMLSDPNMRNRLASNPCAVLDEMGPLPEGVRTELANHLAELVRGGTATGQAWIRAFAAEVTAEARWYGIVVSLNQEATQELVNAGALTAAVINGVAAAFPEPRAKIVLAVLGASIAIIVAALRVIDRGNGVDLTIPWTALLPPPLGIVKVIPTPR